MVIGTLRLNDSAGLVLFSFSLKDGFFYKRVLP